MQNLMYSYFQSILQKRRPLDRFCVPWFLRTIIITCLLVPSFDHADAKGSAVKATLSSKQVPEDVRQFVNGVVTSQDNQGMPFVILDKKRAKIFVYQRDGRNLGTAPALLGVAVGDDYVPGTGQKKLSEIPPEDRTTPAGRFKARLGKNLQGEEVLWVDFDMGIAIHAVVTNHPEERRLQRLRSQNPKEHRISWGCINVPKRFYVKTISPSFKRHGGMVYVLPERKTISDVFGTLSFQSSSL